MNDKQLALCNELTKQFRLTNRIRVAVHTPSEHGTNVTVMIFKHAHRNQDWLLFTRKEGEVLRLNVEHTLVDFQRNDGLSNHFTVWAKYNTGIEVEITA